MSSTNIVNVNKKANASKKFFHGKLALVNKISHISGRRYCFPRNSRYRRFILAKNDKISYDFLSVLSFLFGI